MTTLQVVLVVSIGAPLSQPCHSSTPGKEDPLFATGNVSKPEKTKNNKQNNLVVFLLVSFFSPNQKGESLAQGSILVTHPPVPAERVPLARGNTSFRLTALRGGYDLYQARRNQKQLAGRCICFSRVGTTSDMAPGFPELGLFGNS